MLITLLFLLLAGMAYLMRWTLANLFRLCGVPAPERTHGGTLWLLTIPATLGYFVWFGTELTRWAGF